MNRTRESVMWAALSLLILSCLFPPWRYTYVSPGSAAVVSRPAGYSFLLNPPVPEQTLRTFGVELDGARLVAQCALILVAGGGLVLVLRRKEP